MKAFAGSWSLRRRLLAVFLPLLVACPALAQPRVLDSLDDPAAWKVVTSDGVKLNVAADEHLGRKSLRLDYEFVTGGGYCLIHRALPLDMPANYEFTFQLCGDGPTNNLEFKLLDDSGDSVWWINRRAVEWPRAWTRMVNKKRAIEFAWGPAAGAPLAHLGAIEFAIASNAGGKGSVWLSDLEFRELPPPSDAPLAPTINVDEKPATLPIASGATTTITLDYGRVAEVGGLMLDWGKGSTPPSSLSLEASDDNATWTPVLKRTPTQRTSALPTPDLETRYLRLTIKPAAPFLLANVRSLGPDFSASPNAMMAALAKASPQGLFPRYFNNVQNEWTVVGAPGDTVEALLSVDGQLELSRRGPSIEALVQEGDHLHTWADATHTQSLAEGRLPIPSAVSRWENGLQLTVTAFDQGTDPSSYIRAVYRLKNTGDSFRRGSMFLCLRPFQVNPPWQRLNFEGGVAPIHQLSVEGGVGMVTLSADNRPRVIAASPTRAGVTAFDAGDIVTLLSQNGGEAPGDQTIVDPQGLASGVLRYDFALAPGQELAVPVCCPAHPEVRPNLNETELQTWEGQLSEATRRWRTLTGKVTLRLPKDDQWIADTFAAQLGYIMINRDGPAIQPGSRSYKRSWARDGSMTSAALLACGHPEIVRDWINWFGSHQFDSGKIPCVVDSRGPDPVPEHDSHGEYIWAVADYYRYTHDRGFLGQQWPRVRKAVEYIKTLRAERMTPEFADPASPRHMFYGLVPESISHEGYSAKPMHSYWDDFFVLLGLKEAAYIAGEMHDDALAKDYSELATDFRKTFYDSARASTKAHGIDYMPGCADLGDFDSTSTTIALWPCDEQDHMPQDLLHGTFERAWTNFEERAKSNTWDTYTPYELRHVGAYIRLGWPDRAMQALRWFHQYQRPQGWRQWAEVVYRDETTPKFIGDMPHTWVGSDFLNSVLAMFVYEHDGALVVFGGATRGWTLGTEPVSFQNIITPYGPVSGELDPKPDAVTIRVLGGQGAPAGVLVPLPPGCSSPDAVNGMVRIPAGSPEVTLPRDHAPK
ncbi:MAG: coagulation factor 5/8 type domain-containing protein [Tepidisphaera sp.]|nr:coagulation factor 5/8 type domain-containing protein [Tepidisphaera sp.]